MRGFLSVFPFFRFGEARYFNDRDRAGSFSGGEARFDDDGFLAGASLAGVWSHVLTGWPPRP